MNQELAEITAMQALTYLASDDDLLAMLMQETGISPTDFVNNPEDKDFLAGILDFVLAHEEVLISFCDTNNIAYEVPAAARFQLPGAYHDAM